MSTNQLPRRRDVLVFGGAALAVWGIGSGCALLRGGAKHPVVSASTSKIEGGFLRIPLTELQMPIGEVLEVKPGKPYADLLVARLGDQEYKIVTADCTHKGCTVDFEPKKSEWQCPCHGSRYDVDGKLLEGPAENPLGSLAPRIQEGALWMDLSAAVRESPTAA